MLALNEVHSLQKKAQKCIDSEYEIRKLKDSYDDAKLELQSLRGFGIIIFINYYFREGK